MSEFVQGQLALPVSEDRDHIQGAATAPVTLLEYGDFECPHCGQARVFLQEVLEYFGDDLRFAFRHFPLAQVHAHAEHAAEAAEAAGSQGSFWEMHDTLFENQDALNDVNLLEYAALLQLDVPRFERELRDGVHVARVREDFVSGVRSGVNGTPTFFINGRRHNGGYDTATLTAAIEPEVIRGGAAAGGTRAGRRRHVQRH